MQRTITRLVGGLNSDWTLPISIVIILSIGSTINHLLGVGAYVIEWDNLNGVPWSMDVIIALFGYLFIWLLVLLAIATMYESIAKRKYAKGLKKNPGAKGWSDYGVGYWCYCINGTVYSSRFAPLSSDVRMLTL